MPTKLMRIVKRFLKAEDAVVAMQVTVFSVMLLTSAGLVIDFGRAYSAHTSMQGFVDKAALAAAAELNGEADAIQRAQAAAQAVSQASAFVDGEAQFTVAVPLTFFARNPSEAPGGLDASNPGGNMMVTTDPALAQYVFVQAEARTIELTLMSVGLNSEGTNDVTAAARQRIINEGTVFLQGADLTINDAAPAGSVAYGDFGAYVDSEGTVSISRSDFVDAAIDLAEKEGIVADNGDGTFTVYATDPTTGTTETGQMTEQELRAFAAAVVQSDIDDGVIQTNDRGDIVFEGDETVGGDVLAEGNNSPAGADSMFEYAAASTGYSDDFRAQLAAATNDDGTIDRTTSISLNAFAVARLETSYCGPLSTLVMCNPFEDDAQGRSFADIMEGQEGTRMLLTAEVHAANGGAMPLDTPGSEIRLGLLANPWDEIGGDPTGVCAEENLSAFNGSAYEPNTLGTESDPRLNSPVTTDMLRDMCYLATIDAGLQCIGNEVLVEAAHPETVTTALNTIFDIWDAPLDRVLNQAVTTDRDFAPDYVAVHGMMTREELIENYVTMRDEAETEYYAMQADMDDAATRYYAAQAAGDNTALQEAYSDYQQAAYQQNSANSRYSFAVAEIASATETYPPIIRNTASRRNHVAGDGYGNHWGPMLLGDSCLDTRNGDPAQCTDAPYMDFPRTDADALENGSYNEVSAPYPADEVEYPVIEVVETADETSGNNGGGNGLGNSRGGPQGNNGWGNGDQCAPGGSGGNNNAENSDTVHHIHGAGNPDDCEEVATEESTTNTSTELSGDNLEYNAETLTYSVFNIGTGSDGGRDVAGWTVVNNSSEDESIHFSFRDTDGETAPSVGLVLNVPAGHAIDFQTTFVYDVRVAWENGAINMVALEESLTFNGLEGSTDIAVGLVPTFSSYFAVYYSPYENDNGLSLNNPDSTIEWDIAGASSMYDGYTTVERAYSGLLDASASSGGEQIQTLPRHYQFATTPSVEQTSERRLQRVTLVNCGALVNPVSVEGYAANPDHNGAYLAPVEGVVDLFLTRDVQVANCPGMANESDHIGAMNCWNNQISRAYVHAEFAGIQAPAAEDPGDYLSYAVLVQ
ncbi:pilus assembly protein TadG-related protein [Pontivivens insulae]|uniref:Putative Flp pilus-assembly TadG-like N-terminal domain-containing protein n=1 Tax=Pontivivens insulae TaxID=1639689 RepID=A0A2R8AED4_9RHOB|nr:pilus assembly protein TadG-related protein [Pontivivens insulae]RED14348.1 putative Flp pilus-assembly TadE/G-like protein [Pontivivens insulae]SPF30425.1 hypothetical protein POI8812_02762 [Pontivivens insulae]